MGNMGNVGVVGIFWASQGSASLLDHLLVRIINYFRSHVTGWVYNVMGLAYHLDV